MTIDNDSLARLAHATGMTDVEFDERSQVEAEVAAQQQVRTIDPCWQGIIDRANARRKAELAAPTAGEELEEFALMEEQARQQDEQHYYDHISDPYEDHDYGYHAFHDM